MKPRKTRECSEKEASSSKDDLEEDIKSPEVKSEVAVKPATPIHAKPYKIEAAAAEDPKKEEEIEARIIHLMYNPRVEGKTEVDAEENPEREPVTEEDVAAEIEEPFTRRKRKWQSKLWLRKKANKRV